MDAKYEIVCYGKDGAKIAIFTCNNLDTCIDHVVPGTVKIIIHDAITGKYITEV